MFILSLMISFIITANSGVNPIIYSDIGYVDEVNYIQDVVYYTDFSGEEWSFYGTNDWNCNDQVSVIMFNNFTPNYIYDDVIVNARYTGWR